MAEKILNRHRLLPYLGERESIFNLTAVDRKPLPRVEALGRVKVNFVKAYDKRSVLKASAENKDDDPVLFIDLEGPVPGFTQMKETELHLGISANFRFEPQRDSSVKPHIDLFIPASEIPKLLQALTQANLRSQSSVERVAGGG